jgi:hypothetical protein
MPTISRFLGLTIAMFFRDHDPPHIHVRERGVGESKFGLDGKLIKVVSGRRLSGRKQDVVKAWIHLREKELRANWRRARQEEDLLDVDPLA